MAAKFSIRNFDEITDRAVEKIGVSRMALELEIDAVCFFPDTVMT